MFYSYMVQGGPIMWPIAALSWLATLVALERAFYWLRYALRRDAPLRRDVIDGRLSADVELSRSRDPVAEVARWFRLDRERGRLLADRLLRESRRGIPVLETIASLSTSLGLFGTVVGVSLSFDSMSGGRAEDVARGLSVALFTTVAGLIVYLYCFVASAFFRHFGDGLEAELDLAAASARPAPGGAP